MDQILLKQSSLTQHPVYESLTSLESIRHFMQYHVFAVWDFMSLLKSLQRHITCVSLPWRPSVYPAEVVRLINQIVLGEESDLDESGNAISHFELYLKAMDEIQAPRASINDFLSTMDVSKIPQGAREFVEYNLRTATHGHVVEVASSFFYGREKLIPDMFEVIVSTLERENIQAPTLIYYLKRHIEVDGHEHGPLAQKCLDELIAQDEDLKELAIQTGLKALEMRLQLWDSAVQTFHLEFVP